MTILTDLRMQYYVAKVRSSANAVLQYNRRADSLEVWKWPCHDYVRVHPSKLCDYRITHQMLGPCCLCPMEEGSAQDFVEASIYEAVSGPLSGEYIASCARSKCGYLVWLERLYDKVGVPIKRYPRREPGEQVPFPLGRPVLDSEGVLQPFASTPASRRLKRTYAMLDINQGSIQAHAPVYPANSFRNTTTRLFERLDCHVRAGITEDQFYELFIKCDNCRLIMTKRVFREHACRNVIDLTLDD